MNTYATEVTLTITQAMTCADALIAYALQPDSTDERIRQVIATLRALDCQFTANALEGMQKA